MSTNGISGSISTSDIMRTDSVSSVMSTQERPERNAGAYFRVLRLLEANPVRSQRELAEAVGVSVGTVNKLLKTLVDNRHLQPLDTTHPERTGKKCAYRLTSAGIQHRLAMTRAYLELKTKEYEALHAELASLHAELGQGDGRGQPTGPHQTGTHCLNAGHPLA